MKILAPNAEIITEMTGIDAARADDIEISKHFPGFEFDDEAGAPHLYDAPAVPFPLIIESYARCSQFGRTAACHAPHPFFAAAADGRGFHGQHSRAWQAGPGNLYLCARFPIPQIEFTPLYQIIPCVGVLRAMPPAVRLKWPNDIIIYRPGGGGPVFAKAGGCLTSVSSDPPALTFGIGINIDHAPEIAPGFDLPADKIGHLYPAGTDILKRILFDIMRHIDGAVRGFYRDRDALFDEYAAASALGGHCVTAYNAMTLDIVTKGRFDGITRDMNIRIDGKTFDGSGLRLRPGF